MTILQSMRRLKRPVGRLLVAFVMAPSLLVAQTPGAAMTLRAPAGATAAALPIPLPPGLEAEIQLLQKQVKLLQTNWTNVESSLKPVLETAGKIDALPKDFHPRVETIKAKYGIPASPTLGQEAKGLARYGMDRLGISAERQSGIMKSFQQTGENARNFKPMDPMNIALAVGTVAGMNIISQVASTGQVDVGEAVGFLGTKQFWGGLVGSGIGYSLAGIALTTLLPPGGGIVATVLPTFGAMTAAIVGGKVGAHGFDLKAAMADVDLGQVLGQAAGSTLGMFMGGALGQFLGATLGSMAGPVGTIFGAMILGHLGGALGSGLTKLLKGDSSELRKALEKTGTALKGEGFLPSEIGVASELPGAAFFNDAESMRVKAQYRARYSSFLEAAQAGDQKTAAREYSELLKARREYEQIVRAAFRKMAAEQGASGN